LKTTWSRITLGLDRAAVQRANDGTLEYLTLFMRVGAALWLVLAAVSVFGWIWTGSWRWGATLGASTVFTITWGYVGYWYLGNKEWFRGDPS
jgi:uncharacterized RDD family membrane protein YckC